MLFLEKEAGSVEHGYSTGTKEWWKEWTKSGMEEYGIPYIDSKDEFSKHYHKR